MEGGRGLLRTLKLCVNIECDLNLPTSELAYSIWLKEKWNPVEKGDLAFRRPFDYSV